MLVLEKNALHLPNGPTFGGDQNRQFPQHFDVTAPLHCWHFAKYSPIPYCSTTPVPSQFLHLIAAHRQSRCHFLHTQQIPSSPLIDMLKRAFRPALLFSYCSRTSSTCDGSKCQSKSVGPIFVSTVKRIFNKSPRLRIKIPSRPKRLELASVTL